MSAFGPKQTSLAAPHMSAFGGNVLQNSSLRGERAIIESRQTNL
jgi:hypothetical protein